MRSTRGICAVPATGFQADWYAVEQALWTSRDEIHIIYFSMKSDFGFTVLSIQKRQECFGPQNNFRWVIDVVWLERFN